MDFKLQLKTFNGTDLYLSTINAMLIYFVSWKRKDIFYKAASANKEYS